MKKYSSFVLTVIIGTFASYSHASHRDTLDAANLITGTIDDARLSSNVMLKNTTGTNTSPQTFTSSVTLSGGIGVTAPSTFTATVKIDSASISDLTSTGTAKLAGIQFPDSTIIVSTQPINSALLAIQGQLTGISLSTQVVGGLPGTRIMGNSTSYWQNYSTGSTFGNVLSTITASSMTATYFSGSSVNVINTITAGGGFVGDGSKVTNILGAVMTLPFPSGATNYSNGKGYDIIIGSLTAPNVDIASTTEDGIKAAINALPQGGNILIQGRGSNFTIGGVVNIPAGINIFCSSVTFIPKLSTSTMFYFRGGSMYGKPDFDFNGVATSTNMIVVTSSSLSGFNEVTHLDIKIRNNGLSSSPIVQVIKTTGAFITAELYNFKGSSDATNDTLIGESATFCIKHSTGVHLSIPYAVRYVGATQNECLISFINSQDSYFENSHIANMSYRLIHFEGGIRNIGVRNNFIRVDGTYQSGNGYGLITFKNSTNLAVNGSTSAFTVEGNNFMIATAPGGNPFITTITQTATVNNGIIRNNVLNNIAGTTNLTFINLQDSGANMFNIQGNIVSNINTFISDTGTATKYTSLGNFLGNILQ